MEYHPEWEPKTPEMAIVEHPLKMEKLLRNADLEMAYLSSTVKTYMNVNEMIWGWKQPTTDRDHIDLLATVVEKHPTYFRTAGVSGVGHMSELVAILRDGPQPIRARAETMEDHYQPHLRAKKLPEKSKRRKTPDTDNDWTNGNGIEDGDDDVRRSSGSTTVDVTHHTPSHSHSDSGSSGDSGGGGGGGD